MKLIEGALRKPITVMVAVLAIAFFSVLAIRDMKVDIFPTFGLPTIYVAQPYGGLSPEQMEAFVTNFYEYHFLYVTGVKAVESKSVQGNALIKIIFHEGTDMSQAAAEVVGYVNRSRAFMPPGTVPPFVTRFDAGSVPVGQLVFSSETRTLGEISDLALFKVRPMFSTLPGFLRRLLSGEVPKPLLSKSIRRKSSVTTIHRMRSLRRWPSRMSYHPPGTSG